MSGSTAQKITVAYEVPEADEAWELQEEDVPESAWHDAIIDLLKAILRAWIAREQLNAFVASNLALRWRKDRWKVGVDPDVAVYIPPPPEGEETSSVCTWEPGHEPPRVAVEVVSRSTRDKDYLTAPDQYAASGTAEVWVFDPKRLGPRVHGGPYRLQVWRRDERGTFRKVYAGDGPFQSPELGAWLVITNGGKRLRLADDAKGARLWLTETEQAVQALDAQRQALDAERAAREAAEAELARLRASLAAKPARRARTK